MQKTTSQWLTYLRGTPTNNVVSQKITTELSSAENYGENYVEYVRGYFFAPVDGVYRFSVVADDDFMMVMSSVKNNAHTSNLVPLLTQENYNTHHYLSYTRANVTNTVNVTLTQGSYYYFELVNINYGGNGFFKVYVDMPSLRQYTINTAWQVDRVTLKPSVFDAEIIKVRVFAASGNYDLFYYESSGAAKIANFPVGCSVDTFIYFLWNLPNIYNYGPTVTRTTLDASGNPTNVAGSIEGYEYTITLNRHRPAASLPNTRGTALVAGSVPTSLTITRPSTHSPPLSGTFKLLINNVPLTIDNGNANIPYNVDLTKI